MSAQAAAELIDSYLLRQGSQGATGHPSAGDTSSSPPAPLPGVTASEFRQLVSALPPEARPSHDLLLRAVLVFLHNTATAKSSTDTSAAETKASPPSAASGKASSEAGAGKPEPHSAFSHVPPPPLPPSSAVLVALVDCSRLSSESLEVAGGEALLPLPFRIAALRILKDVRRRDGGLKSSS